MQQSIILIRDNIVIFSNTSFRSMIEENRFSNISISNLDKKSEEFQNKLIDIKMIIEHKVKK